MGETSWSTSTTLPLRIERAIRIRLEKVCKLIKSKRWHEAMAIGILHNRTSTAQQVDDIVRIIIENTDCPKGYKERASIGLVYISTELFMLTDESPEFEETWKFLEKNTRQLDYLANSFLNPSPTSLTAITAVTSSFVGGFLSVMMPTVHGTMSSLINNSNRNKNNFEETPLTYESKSLSSFEKKHTTN